jgi:hypothetical protein
MENRQTPAFANSGKSKQRLAPKGPLREWLVLTVLVSDDGDGFAVTQQPFVALKRKKPFTCPRAVSPGTGKWFDRSAAVDRVCWELDEPADSNVCW